MGYRGTFADSNREGNLESEVKMKRKEGAWKDLLGLRNSSLRKLKGN